MSERTRANVMAVTALLAVVAAGCSSSSGDVTDTGPSASVSPTSFILAAGDSSVVTVFSPQAGSVAWRSSNPAVVTVDSLVDVGTAAVVRAHAAGSASLNGTVKVGGRTFTPVVSVRVGGG